MLEGLVHHALERVEELRMAADAARDGKDLGVEHGLQVDKPVVESTLISRLSYSPLTRQYRLSRGGLSQSFDSLKDALDVLKNIHQWRVSSRPSIDTPDNYEANVRIKLDTTQLPLPLQVTIGDNDWDISSEWYSLTLTEQALSADDSN